MSRAPCRACGAENARAARYCVACGFELEGAVVRRARELDSSRRLVIAIAVLFLGTLVAVSVSSFVFADSPVLDRLLSPALLSVVGLGSAACLGAGALRASFARGTSVRALAAGAAGGAIAFAISWGIAQPRTSSGHGLVSLPAVVWMLGPGLCVLTPLAEEWLCRGVLWLAVRRALSDGSTIFISAALFAFLHGLGGSGWLEYPHRFAAGLIFGVLRARSGSLWPGILGHALHNTLVLAFAFD